MSEVPKTPNPEQPGRILEEHMREGLVIDGEPPGSGPMNDNGGSYSYAAVSCAIWPSIAPGWTSKCSTNCSTQGTRRPRSGVKFMGTSSTYPCWTGANCLLTATMASTTGGASLENPDRFEADLYTTLAVTVDAFATR